MRRVIVLLSLAWLSCTKQPCPIRTPEVTQEIILRCQTVAEGCPNLERYMTEITDYCLKQEE